MKEELFLNKLNDDLEKGLPRSQARELCFKEISANPGNKSARLLLAKLYYLDSFEEFSIRELIELQKRAPSASIEALIKSFGPVANQFQGGPLSEDNKTSTHGELDFDFSIFDDES